MAAGRPGWALFLLMLFSAAAFHHPVEYDNTLSRDFLMSSVVDDGRLDLEMYRGRTVDVSVYGGRVFSNKAFGLPLLGAPAYWLARHAGGLGPLSPLPIYLARVWAVSLPFALLGPIFYQLLLAMGAGAGDAFLAALAYALGTIAWNHASLFSGHATAGSFAFLSFAACWSSIRSKSAAGWRWFGAGLLTGLGVLCEFQAAVAAAALTVYVLLRARGAGARAAFLAGGGVCLALLLAYDAVCFGSPWSLSYAHQGPQFAASAAGGFLGLARPDLGNLLRLLVSPARGLFFIMPVLLLSIPGFVALFRRRESRPEAAVLASIALGALLLNAAYVNWHAGWTFGPRYLISMLPFLVVPMAFGMDRAWFIPLFLLSFLQVGLAQAALPYAPQAIRNPLVESLWPLFREGYRSDNLGTLLGLSGAWSLLPWLLITGGLAAWGWPERGAPFLAARRRGARAWGWLYGAACAGVVCGLAAVRSPREATAHGYNAKLMSDYAQVRPSPAVSAAIVEETRLHGPPP